MEPSGSVIKTPKNEYRGPNAHLLSLHQTPRPDASTWRSFHSAYISLIASALNAQLPDEYMAVTEESLQIQIVRPTSDPVDLPPRYPDIAVYKASALPAVEVVQLPAAIAVPDQILPHIPVVADIDTWAVLVYTVTPNSELGDAIVRIELLSSSNKRNRKDMGSYMRGRDASIRSGTVLYELDLLHESASPLDIPVYPDDEGSHPYYIAVTDPRQTRIETLVKGFNVDDPFPLVNILLVGRDVVQDFDFGQPYNETFERGRWGTLVNYAELPDPKRVPVMLQEKGKTVPPAISTYNPHDQERIRQRMKTIADAQHMSS